MRLLYLMVNFVCHLHEFPLSWLLNLPILVPQARLPCLQLFTTLGITARCGGTGSLATILNEANKCQMHDWVFKIANRVCKEYLPYNTGCFRFIFKMFELITQARKQPISFDR